MIKLSGPPFWQVTLLYNVLIRLLYEVHSASQTTAHRQRASRQARGREREVRQRQKQNKSNIHEDTLQTHRKRCNLEKTVGNQMCSY